MSDAVQGFMHNKKKQTNKQTYKQTENTGQWRDIMELEKTGKTRRSLLLEEIFMALQTYL